VHECDRRPPQHRFYKPPALEAATLNLALMQDLAEHFDPALSVSQHIPEFQFCKLLALAHNSITGVLLAANTVCLAKRVEAGKGADGAIKNLGIPIGTYVLDLQLVKMECESIAQKCHSYAILHYIEQAMAAYVAADHWTALWNRWENLKYMSVRWDQGFYERLIGLVFLGAIEEG